MSGRPVLSVVDYDAWRKGYMPPTEHVLIHELSVGSARVPCMSSIGRDFTWWLVVSGDISRKRLAQITNMLHAQMNILDDQWYVAGKDSDVAQWSALEQAMDVINEKQGREG